MQQKEAYEKLDQSARIRLLNIALDFLWYKPSLIGDVKNYTEYLDKIEEFAMLIHERFPNFKRASSVIRVPTGI